MPAQWTRRTFIGTTGALGGAMLGNIHAMADSSPILKQIQSHFDKLLEHGLDRYGKTPTAMWMASLDTRTGRYPEDDRRPPEIPRRHYRAIDAPKGCSMYWDQPSLVAAHALSAITGNARYTQAADAYVRDFMERCIARNGVFLWGNHYFWDAFRDCTVKFKGDEDPHPIDFEKEEGDYHEARPLPPAWELFWKVSPEKTERAIRAYVQGSLFDPEHGGFNRHADRKKGCAFLESGGILVESLGFLFARTKDAALLDTAQKIVAFCCAKRDPTTRLLPVNSTVTRWDRYCSSTEVGLWGGSVLRASGSFAEPATWENEVALAVSAFLERGYDDRKNAFYGKLVIEDGSPVIGERRWPGDSNLSDKHRPDDYADIWRPLFPAHDYPMPFAECCLTLFKRTRKDIYHTACNRWKNIIETSLPARNGRGAYAEHYGRCIHFLLGGAETFEEPAYAKAARRVADEALAQLFDEGLFRSHPGEHRYDAVDGVGMLLIALLWLETGKPPADMGFGW